MGCPHIRPGIVSKCSRLLLGIAGAEARDGRIWHAHDATISGRSVAVCGASQDLRQLGDTEANTHHVERGDMLEADISILKVLHEVFVYKLWTAASWQSKDERLLRRRLERSDTFLVLS